MSTSCHFSMSHCIVSAVYTDTRYSYQNVKGYSPLISAALVLPLVVTQSITSTLAGLSMSHFNCYAIQIWIGFGVWLLGSGLLILAKQSLHPGLSSFFLILVGMGTGNVFQPTLVALQAQTPKAQRAVVTSNRNFLRSSGGAVGLAVSSAILANVLKSSLPPRLAYVANSTFAAPNLSTFSTADRNAIAQAYADASRAVFIWCVPLIGVCLLLCAVIRDHGLIRSEEKEAPTPPPGEVLEKTEQQDTEKNHPTQHDSSVLPSTDVSRKPSSVSIKSTQGHGGPS